MVDDLNDLLFVEDYKSWKFNRKMDFLNSGYTETK